MHSIKKVQITTLLLCTVGKSFVWGAVELERRLGAPAVRRLQIDCLEWCQREGGEGAVVRSGRVCLAESFLDDCVCLAGYKQTSEACIFCNLENPSSWCEREGGEGATAVTGQDCYDDFEEDCTCLDTYKKQDGGCTFCNRDNRHQWCKDQAGYGEEGAIAKEGQACYLDFEEDCLCSEAYVKENGGCKLCKHDNLDGWCAETAKYGKEGAVAVAGQDCYDDFQEDCGCTGPEYRKAEDGCEKCNLEDPSEWCRGMGGEFAYALEGQDCYTSFTDDCLCNETYSKVDGECEYECNTSGKGEDWCQSIGGEGAFASEDVDCWDDFLTTCHCYDGYNQTATGCDKLSTPLTGNQIRHVGNNGSPEGVFPLKNCQGDCDDDNNCEGDLKCFQRDTGNITVPGCFGGEGDPSDHDYCYDPSTPLPTEAPTNIGEDLYEECHEWASREGECQTKPDMLLICAASCAALSTNSTVKEELPVEIGLFNITYTGYSFVGDNLVEVGCSFTQTSVTAACQGGEISFVDMDPTCLVTGTDADGSSRFTCGLAVSSVSRSANGTTVDSDVQNVADVTFRCIGGLFDQIEANEFTCGGNLGVVSVSSSKDQPTVTTVSNVGNDTGFRWGLFGPNLCLNSQQGSPSTTEVLRNKSWNPDIDEP